MGSEVPAGWSGGVGAGETWRAWTRANGWTRDEADGGSGDEEGGAWVRSASDSGRVVAARGDCGDGDDGAADAGRSRAAAGRQRPCWRARSPAASVRASEADGDVAIGHFHVLVAEARADLHRRVSGRPLEVLGELVGGAPAEVGAGDGGVGARDRGIRGAARGAYGPRAAVQELARRDGVRGGAEAARDPAHSVAAAASADAGEGGAVLEDAVGRVLEADDVRGFRRFPAAVRALRAGIQLPAAAPGAGGRRAGAGGQVLRDGAALAGGRGAEREGEHDADGAGAAAAEAVLRADEVGEQGAAGDGGGTEDPGVVGERGVGNDRTAQGGGCG